MSYQVLARKYRPQRFDQLVGQEHVVQALANALTQGRLHHAYLFTGTRGVGKTTVSRILAKSLNCTGADGQGGITAEPCGVCPSCRDIDAGRFVDYVELDAASNRGVEEISQLLDQSVYKPVVGRFKVYMIDEVHMLSNTAFNAMLKTLEEPPDYLKFVLATTDPQKVPVTVLSRCLQFNLRPMAAPDVQSHLGQVLQAEAVPAEAGALRLLARAARGSMRDGLSLADQAIAFGAGSLTEAGVRQMLGSVDRSHVVGIVDALASSSGEAVVAQADGLRSLGLSAAGTLEDLASLMQQIALAQAAPGALDDTDPEVAEVRRLATLLPADEVQLIYSMALHGRQELHLAPDEYAGLLMVLLRMLSFRPAGAPSRAAPKTAPLVRPPAVAKAVVTVPLPSLAAEPKPVVKAQVQAPIRVDTPPTPAPAPAPAIAPRPAGEPAKLSERLRPRPVEAPPDMDEAGAPPDDAPPPWLEAEDAASMAAEPALAPARSIELVETPEGSRWQARIQPLGLTAMVRELALQAQCLGQTEVDGRVCWRLRVERESLRATALVAKLEAALDAKLDIEPGVAVDSMSLRAQAAAVAQQKAAEALAAGHPTTQRLLQQFKSARILPGSVQPLSNSNPPRTSP
jgi:DNA polymerase-3 subunit gamma/tau